MREPRKTKGIAGIWRSLTMASANWPFWWAQCLFAERRTPTFQNPSDACSELLTQQWRTSMTIFALKNTRAAFQKTASSTGFCQSCYLKFLRGSPLFRLWTNPVQPSFPLVIILITCTSRTSQSTPIWPAVPPTQTTTRRIILQKALKVDSIHQSPMFPYSFLCLGCHSSNHPPCLVLKCFTYFCECFL